MREEARRIAGGTEVEAFDDLDSGAAEHALGDRPEVQVPAAERVSTETLAIRPSNVVADFVATRPDPWTDHCPKPSAEHSDARREDAL
jgi:hypothetical protein